MTGRHEISVFSHTLYKMGIQNNKLTDYLSEFEAFMSLISGESGLGVALKSPKIKRADKKAMLEKTLGKSFSEEFLAFVFVVLTKRCQNLYKKIFESFRALVDHHENVARGRVYSATEVDQKTISDIESLLAKRIDKKVILSSHVREEILGGLILEVEDSRIDLSVLHNMEMIKDNILNTKLRGAMS